MNPRILHIDLPLVCRAEMAEADAARTCAEAARLRHPESEIAVMEFAGGIAVFGGKDSPITQAVGAGLGQPVTEAELDALEDFFRERGAPVSLEICPLVGLAFYETLAKREYRLREVSNVLVRSLGETEKFAVAPSGVDVRIVDRSEADLWTRTVAEGFAESYSVSPSLLEVMEGFFYRSRAACFLAQMGGEVAGGAVASAYKGVGGLFGASTLPAFRRRGVQTALLAARLEWVRQQGCDLAVSIALPGSISQRNIERTGFQVAYTRTKMVLSSR
jgi:GNAT superfamily N-acetyltransferase